MNVSADLNFGARPMASENLLILCTHWRSGTASHSCVLPCDSWMAKSAEAIARKATTQLMAVIELPPASGQVSQIVP
eukprot:4484701-Prymnesium_polylepis.3